MSGQRNRVGENGKKVFWGILLLLAAAALVVSRLGYLEGIGVWSILFSACLFGFFIDGFFKRSFTEILFAIAFFIIVNDELLGLEAITPWPVLGAALLGTIGLKLLFPKFKSRHKIVTFTMNGKEYDSKEPVFEETWEGSNVSYQNVFGESVKYPAGEISHVSTENAFGSMQIYFTNAALKGGSAAVDVESAFGNTILYVPASWKVILSTEHFFGSVKEYGRCDPQGENVLYIRGEVCFGSLQIRYV